MAAYELLHGVTRQVARAISVPAGGCRRAHMGPEAGPSPGVSRSYAGPYALVGWHHRRIGVDIEAVADHGREFGESICTPAERLALNARLDDPELVTALWSAKEALAKALGDALSYDPRRLDSPLVWPATARWRAERIAAPTGYVGWVCWERA